MPAETLPCGCIIDTVGDAFVMQPHSLDCRYYRYFLAQSRRQDKPVRVIEDPAADPMTGLRARVDADRANTGPLGRPVGKCPRCGGRIGGHTPVDAAHQEPPVEGNLSVCEHCGGLGIYDAAGQIRLPTKQEQAEAMADPEVRRVLAMARRRSGLL